MDRAEFLTPRLPESEVKLDIGTIRVRGLSRAEALALKGMEPEEIEVRALAMGMMDPELTVDDVRVWQSVALADEVKAVLDAIYELSGLREGSAKAAYKSVPGES